MKATLFHLLFGSSPWLWIAWPCVGLALWAIKDAIDQIFVYRHRRSVRREIREQAEALRTRERQKFEALTRISESARVGVPPSYRKDVH